MAVDSNVAVPIILLELETVWRLKQRHSFFHVHTSSVCFVRCLPHITEQFGCPCQVKVKIHPKMEARKIYCGLWTVKILTSMIRVMPYLILLPLQGRQVTPDDVVGEKLFLFNVRGVCTSGLNVLATYCPCNFTIGCLYVCAYSVKLVSPWVLSNRLFYLSLSP